MMFHEGDLQTGISRAIQEQKLVACFVRQDNDEECTTWENSYLPSVSEALSSKAILLKIDNGSQEAGFLAAFCPISRLPTLVIIQNGQVLEKLEGGINQDEFNARLSSATGAGLGADGQLSREATQAGSRVEGTNENQTTSPQPAPSEQSQPTHESPSVQGLFPGRAERLESDHQRREVTEKAERAARAKARRKEAEQAQAADKDKGKQRATGEIAEKEKARQAWIVQQKQRKDEAKQERQRILDQIENDKQNRKARAEQQKAANDADGPSEPLRDSTDAASRRRSGAGGMCSLQVRLFDGSSIRRRFEPSATLASGVRSWIQETAMESGADVPYTFRQILAPQPSRSIEVSEEHQTLQELGLAPSATLVLAPVAGYTDAYASGSGRGYVGTAISTAYNVVGGVASIVSSVLSYVPGFAAPSSSEQVVNSASGNDQAESSSSIHSADSGSAKIKMKTLADQRAEAASKDEQQTEFYNGNSSAFEGRKDEDANDDA